MASEKYIIPGLAVLAFFLWGNESKASSSQQSYSGPMGSPKDYIKANYPLAKITEQYYSIPALFTIAQGGIESSWGASNLAVNAKNHFGIKADSKWTGPSYSGYRKYSSIQDSYSDQGKFLATNSRYNPAFIYTDPYYFAKAIADAGYAENPNYYSIISSTMDSVQKLL